MILPEMASPKRQSSGPVLLRLLLAAGLSLLLSGCLVTERELQMQRELLELKRRVDGVERNVQAVQQDTAGGVKKRIDTLTSNQADLQAGLDGLRVDVQGHSGRFDDLGRADRTLRQDLTLVRDELSLQVADLGQRLAKVEQAQSQAAAAAAAPPAVNEGEDLYEKGLKTIREQQDLPAGREQMTQFLKNHPKDSRAANAAYWIGETYYAEKAYEKAVLQFEEVIQQYGDNPKVASALYKQALAFDALKDRKSARLVMKKVTERFPLADEAKLAKDKLKEWGP